MAQASNWAVANGGGAAVRAAINALFAVLQSDSSGPSAPSPTVAGMGWFDTTTLQFKKRNAANTAWIVVAPETIPANTFWCNPTGAAAAPQAGTMAQLKTMLGYSQTLATPGTQTFPSGLILNWGSFSLGAAGGASQTVTFATAFPNAILGSWIRVANAADQMIGTSALGLATMNINKGAADVSARSGTYFAIGI